MVEKFNKFMYSYTTSCSTSDLRTFKSQDLVVDMFMCFGLVPFELESFPQ